MTASASSGLTVSFASDNTSVATVSGNTVTIVGVGTTNITASQAGDANFNAASDYVRQLVVLPNSTTPGNALFFNGISDFVTVPFSEVLTSYTIETWVKPTSTADQCIISYNDASGGTHSNGLEIKDGKFRHYTYDNAEKTVSGTTSVQTGVWYHVAITASNGGLAHLYVNGTEEGTPVSITTLWTLGNKFYFGKSGINAQLNYFSGSLDELRIWNTQRNDAQIQSSMYNTVSTSAGQSAYYRFDQSSGTVLYDLTSNHKDGTIVNPNWTESYAMVVPVPQDASAISNTSFTANWTAPLVGDVTKYLLEVSTTSNFSSHVSGYNPADCGTSISKEVTGLSPNTIYYYRVRADKTSVTGQGGLYRNNTSVTTLKTAQSITFSPITSPVILGVSPITITGSASSGLDVSFASDNETVATVSGNMVTVLSAGIVNITACQAGNSTFAPATNVVRSFEVLPNMITPGNALTFNGVNEFANVPYNFTGYTAYTIEMWVKPSSTANQVIISGNEGSGGTESHALRISNGKFQQFTWDGAPIYITGTTDIQVGKWYHVAITATNGGLVRLFVNGVEEGNALTVGTLWTGGTQFYIGRSGFGNAYFNGSVDEVRLWNFAKDGATIQTSMYNIVNQSSTGLVSYYKFDQSSGNILYDATSNVHNGTISNANWTESYAMVVPTPQAADNILNNNFTAHWAAPAVGTVEKYLLDVSTASDFSSFVTNYNSKDCGTNLSQSVTGLSAGITYYYRVRAEKTSVSGQGGLYRNVISVSIPPSDQSINFTTISSPVILGVSPITLSATATSGLDVTFMSDNPSVASVSGNTLTVVGGGIVHITANQLGNTNFNAAANVTQTLTVNMTPPGNALHFMPSNSNSINCGSILNSATAFTIEGWIKPEDNFGPNVIFASKYTGCNTGGFALYFNSFNSQDNALVVETDNCGTIYTAGGVVKIGVWQHIALVVSSFNSVKLYINGVEQTIYGNFAMTSLSVPLTFGDFSGGGSHFYFKGAMDEVRVWNSARLSTDIQNNMYNPALGTEEGLISYYNFDIGSASSYNSGLTTLYDKTSHTNNGTLSNFTLNGGSSNWVESYAMVVPVPQAATDVQTTSFTAHWNAPAIGTVTNYLLDVSTSSTFTSFVEGYLGFDCGTNFSQPVIGLSQGTTYYYRVTANKTSVSGQGRPSNNYTSVTTNATQTISFSAISSSIIMGVSPITLSATTTSGLTVSFASNNEAVATVSGNIVTIVGIGTVIITASQAGNSVFAAAPNVVHSFEVLPNMIAPGNAIIFNGINEYATVPYNFSGYTAYTIEAWIKPLSTANQVIIAGTDGSGTTESHAIRIAGGKFQHYTYDATEISVNGTTTVQAGVWYHVAISATSGGVARLFVNGVEEGTALTINTLWPGGNQFYFGKSGMTATYFSGSLDEVRFWNSARLGTDIQTTMYNVVSPTADGLVSYYRCDQTVGNTLYDLTLNRNDGTVVNASWVESYAMVVPVPQTADNILNTSFMAHWTAPTVGIVEKYLLDVSMASDFSSFVSGYNAVDCGTSISKAVTVLSPNTTYYYRVRADKTSVIGQGGLYKNNISVTTLKTVQSITFSPITSPVINGVSPITLSASSNSGLEVSFSSDNDAVATVSGNIVTVLSAGIVNITASQAGNSSFASATNVIRSFEVLPNMTTPGNALSFNGSSDNVSVPYNFSGFTTYTIEAWIKPLSTTDQVIIAGTNGNGASESHAIRIAGGKFQHYTYDGNMISVNGTTNVQAGIWYHVAITATNGGLARLFVNGVEEGNALPLGSLWAAGTQFYIGKSGFGNAYFNGSVDEVRIWNFAKDGTAIQNTMYNAVNQSSIGLVSYYKFDQNTGNNLYDASSNANHGTIVNSNWTESYAMVEPIATAATDIGKVGFTANWTVPAKGNAPTDYFIDVATDAAFTAMVSGWTNHDVGSAATSIN
ncbi:MAG: LamG-like jellyroll fold domain-containing protein, partial [Mariniphaga sp.]